MTDEKIIEAMARLDGLTGIHYDYEGVMWGARGSIMGQDNLPNMEIVSAYLTDNNAVQRVIDGLGRNESIKFTDTLFSLVPLASKEMNYKWYYTEEASRLLKATPRQKCEAVLKAKGVWDDQ